MAEEITLYEKQVAVNVVVGMADVTVNFGIQEVIVMPATLLSGGGGVMLWESKSTTFVPASGGAYEVDTQGAPVDVLLPASPADGYQFYLRDGYATFGTNACNLVPAAGSGHKVIQTSAPEEILSLNYPHVGTGFLIRFRAIDNTWSW